MFYKINLSLSEEYYSQRNNKILPYSTCGETAMINGLVASKISFNYPKDQQPEDYLTSIIRSDEGYEKLKEIAPWFATGSKSDPEIQTILAMLEWGTNKLCGRLVCKLDLSGSLKKIIWNLANGGCSLVMGSFTAQGHFVCIVGCETEQHIWSTPNFNSIQLEAITSIIMDDPYGNWFSGYANAAGNDTKFTIEQLRNLIGQDGKIWTHYINSNPVILNNL